jgi:hypothetical protein
MFIAHPVTEAEFIELPRLLIQFSKRMLPGYRG